MQAYANVGTLPTRHTTKASGKNYWEFRASESARGEEKDPTWYTVRVFKDEDPQLKKGDFVVFTGKLKNDVFMGRDGKPMGVLTVLAFNLQKVAKDGKRETLADTPQTTETVAAAIKGPAKTLGKAEATAPPPVAAATEAAPPAKMLFGGFGQWGLTPQAMRFGT
jgi:single-stranded DNA-binding protein